MKPPFWWNFGGGIHKKKPFTNHLLTSWDIQALDSTKFQTQPVQTTGCRTLAFPSQAPVTTCFFFKKFHPRRDFQMEVERTCLVNHLPWNTRKNKGGNRNFWAFHTVPDAFGPMCGRRKNSRSSLSNGRFSQVIEGTCSHPVKVPVS